MFRKAVLILSIVIVCFFCVNVSAQQYKSSRFILTYAKVVISGGQAGSFNYILENVEIGNLFSGMAQSASFTLDTKSIEIKSGPNAPTHEPLGNLTNIPIKDLYGSKDRATSLYIDGYETVPLDYQATWSHEVILKEGDNTLIITSRDEDGLESESDFVDITLDTIPPDIIIEEPFWATVLTDPQVAVKGTIDGDKFSEDRELEGGLNILIIEASDEAENEASEGVAIYKAHKPIAPPKLKKRSLSHE